jgi:flagellar basal-body rod protein FlgF
MVWASGGASTKGVGSVEFPTVSNLLIHGIGIAQVDFRLFFQRSATYLLLRAWRTFMDSLTISAASGLRARMESLDMLANNLANAGTSGYKGDYESYGLYAGSEGPAALNGQFDPARPGTLPVIERPWTDFSQGLLQSTGNSFDLAISGKGLFVVTGPSGPLYTRNGSFHMDEQNRLVSADGYPLQGQDGTPLQLDPAKPVEVATDGTVLQGGQAVGRVQVVGVEDQGALTKIGHSYFRTLDPAAKPNPAKDVQVHQGKLENSNVSPAESAVRLVSVMRQFEMLHRAISLGAEMNRKAVEEVARVGS